MKIKLFALICMLVLCFVVVTGCGWLQQLQDWKNGTSENDPGAVDMEQQIQQTPDNQGQPVPGQGETAGSLDNSQQSDPSQMRDVVLYFAKSDGSGLEGEIRSIPRQEGIARATINELIAGPSLEGLLPTIPAATILEGINIRDGICTVDFSEELSTDHPGGLENEELTVYSIVNTLSQFDSIQQVKILVGGKEVDTLAGHVDVSEAMAPYQDLIK